MHTSGKPASHYILQGKCATVGLLLLAASGAILMTHSQAAVRVGPEYTFPGGDNGSCDICVHPGTGQPHVVWETNDGHVRYSSYDGSRWSPPEQLPGVASVGARQDRFRYGAVTMEIDSAGRVHVVYTTGGTRRGVYHVRQMSQGGAWSAPVLVHDAGRAQPAWVQMARNSRDRLYVSFEQGLRAFCCEHDGSKWGRAKPLAGRTSHVHHIAMGPDDVPRILFKVKDRGGYEAYLATKRRAGWNVRQITSDGGDVDCPSGAVDAANRLHVIWSKCAEEGHDAVLKYDTCAGARVKGTVIAKTNAHNFCRMAIDEAGALYVFLPRRYPPKFLVREAGERRWSAPTSLGAPRQGYWFLEAAAHGSQVHLVYSNWYAADRPKGITYRKITRTKKPPGKPSTVIGDIGNEVGLDTKISDRWIKHWTDFFDAHEASHPGVTVLCTIDTSGDRGHFDRMKKLNVIDVHGGLNVRRSQRTHQSK